MSREQKRALARVRRTADKLEHAKLERDTAIEDVLMICSVRQVAEAAHLSPARVHQIRHGR